MNTNDKYNDIFWRYIMSRPNERKNDEMRPVKMTTGL